MFCCLDSKKILSSAIDPSPAFQSKKFDALKTRYPKRVEILKVIDSLKKIKEAPNQLLDNVPSNK